LVNDGFPPEDIVFDPNVLAIATGMLEHDSYAADFIRACAWIREHCPYAQISGGVSNLSFSFRGNETVRNAMHSVFLHHAVNAGLSMAIVNPANLIPYEDIDPALRTAAEAAIILKESEKLLSLALSISQTSAQKGEKGEKKEKNEDWREKSAEDRVLYALLNGDDAHIESDMRALMEKKKKAADIIEGTLMNAMGEVGARFADGKLFLPQVIRSARVMKKAVSALEPFLMAEKASADGRARSAKIVLATVKGDVHDIGKNIVGVVLACNGYEIIDLGVMVPSEKIIETAIREKADLIGLSGLITPSLDEMIKTAQAMEKAGLSIPLLIGGAAASLAHTALRIDPEYSAPVVYTRDASQAAAAVRALISESGRASFLQNLEDSYREALEAQKAKQSRKTVSLEEARRNRFSIPAVIPAPRQKGAVVFTDYPVERVSPYLNWRGFAAAWRVSGKKAGQAEREQLIKDAEAFLARIQAEKLLSLRAVFGVFRAEVENETVSLFPESPKEKKFMLHFMRNRSLQKAGSPNPCVSDFIAADENGEKWLGAFALSAGFGADKAGKEDGYNGLLSATLANALAEAFAEELHSRVRKEFWAYAPNENSAPKDALAGKYQGIRPAFGYPILPNHADKRAIFALLRAEERIGLSLTESAMMIPAASICGLFLAHPSAFYFTADAVGD
jgi:5-methyltetrahydrofolate--homocysteine methyltransferase